MREDAAPDLAASMQSLRDREEIKQLRARLARFVDLHEWDAWRELLTEDFRLEAEGAVHEGRDAIVSFVSVALGEASTVHQYFHPDITVEGETATGMWGYEDRIVFPTDAQPVVLHGFGYVTDEYVRTDSGWRIRSTVETKLQASDS
jgi:hypothetical protein